MKHDIHTANEENITNKARPTQRNWIYAWMLIGTFSLAVILSFGLGLPYNLANSDIVLYASVLPEILNTLLDLVEILTFAPAFSILIWAVFGQMPHGTVFRLTLIYLGAVLFRRLCDLSVILILYGSILIDDVIYNLLYLIYNVALSLTVIAISRSRFNTFCRHAAKKIKTASLLQSETAEPSALFPSFYPFQKKYSKKNPLQVTALLVGMILSAVKVLGRIIFDINYGAPEDFSEALLMAGYYCYDLLLGVFFYALAMLIFGALYKKASRDGSVH